MTTPPILMIHGMWSRPSTFATLREELEAVGIRSVAPTLRMHDVAPGAPAPAGLATLSLQDYVAALEQEVADMGALPVILGHSMGGLLAQKLAMAVRPPGLILLSTAPSSRLSALSIDAIRASASITTRWGWWKRATLLDEKSARFGVYNGVPEEEVRAAIAELTWDSGHVLRQIAFPFTDSARGARVDYDRLAIPALVIAGLADRIVPPAVSRGTARALSAAGARVDYEEWPAVGHWLFHDAVRPRLAAAIARFIASLPAD